MIILRKCMCSLQCWHFFGPSDSPAHSTTSIDQQPWEWPFTINWRSQRNWVEQPLGKFSLIIYHIKCIIFCHGRKKKTKQNSRIGIGSRPYKIAQNGDSITQTKVNSWQSITGRKWGLSLITVCFPRSICSTFIWSHVCQMSGH